jgi:hypothetical protein
LFFNADNIVHRFRISGRLDKDDNNHKLYVFNIGGRDFTAITSIIERYMNEEITGGYRLSKIPHNRLDIFTKSMPILDNNNQTMIENNDKLQITNKRDYENDLQKDSPPPPNYFNIGLNSDNTTNSSSQNLNESTTSTSSSNSSLLNKNSKQNLTKNKSQASISSGSKSNNHFNVTKSLSSPIASLFFNNNNQNKSNSTDLNPFSCSSNKSIINEILPNNYSNNNSTAIKTNNNDNNLIKKSDKIILKGYLYKYIEKTKKWKLYWFSLNQSDQQLFYFSNEKVKYYCFLTFENITELNFKLS